MLSIGL